MTNPNATRALTITTEEKRLRAVQLRERGAKYRDIAQVMGISLAYAYQLVRESLDELHDKVSESAAEVRTLELSRLDDLWLRLTNSLPASVKQPDGTYLTPVTDPAVINSMLRVMERRAKLLGLDAPTMLSGPDGGPIPIAAVDAREVLLAKMTQMAERMAGQVVSATAPADVPS